MSGERLHLWSVKEAAENLRISPDTLRRSTCPSIKLGGRRLYDPEQCMAWARQGLTHNVITTIRKAS